MPTFEQWNMMIIIDVVLGLGLGVCVIAILMKKFKNLIPILSIIGAIALYNYLNQALINNTIGIVPIVLIITVLIVYLIFFYFTKKKS